MGFVWPVLFTFCKLALSVFGGFIFLDAILLFLLDGGVRAERTCPERLSNGDANKIEISIHNDFKFRSTIRIIDEVPVQLQIRDFLKATVIEAESSRNFSYSLRPVERGEYHFGDIICLAESPLKLLRRRFAAPAVQMVPVYPSFIQMRRYEMMAISNRLSEVGIKRIRRLGHTMEFDQIREYVPGDDIRTINWQATARKTSLMVNSYEDERSQHIYSVINMGRVMQMPFDGLSLLDYAINASLVISNIAMRKQDKAGVITFSNQVNDFLKAQRQPAHMARILELLYRQETQFKESDYEALFLSMLKRLTQRSLILLFSNFETLSGLRRQLASMQRLARHHVLVVVFFENIEMTKLLQQHAVSTEDIYLHTIARQFSFEKRQIVKELQRYGIHSILTAPENLTVNAINKYLYLKARGII